MDLTGDDDGFLDPPSGPLLPPDDRNWRHPSEIAAVGLPAASRSRRRPRLTPGHHHRRAVEAWAPVVLAGVVGAMLSAALLAATGGLGGDRAQPTSGFEVAPSSTVALAVRAAGASPSELAEAIRPSLVAVSATTPSGRTVRASAVAIDAGLLVTARRAVDGASRVQVGAGTTEVAAEVVGTDPDTDLAVLSAPGLEVPAAPLGSTAGLRPGDTAVAVSTKGVGAAALTVSAGVISAVSRSTVPDGGTPLRGVLQIDRAVPPEGAGGALVDLGGTVVGITLPSGTDQPGFGWAVPIELANDVAHQLVKAGRVAHPWLGVEGSDHGMTGAVVRAIRSSSPAERAGLRAGDVVTAVDGVPVTGMESLLTAVATRRPGQHVTLSIVRGGERRDVVVTLAAKPR